MHSNLVIALSLVCIFLSADREVKTTLKVTAAGSKWCSTSFMTADGYACPVLAFTTISIALLKYWGMCRHTKQCRGVQGRWRWQGPTGGCDIHLTAVRRWLPLLGSSNRGLGPLRIPPRNTQRHLYYIKTNDTFHILVTGHYDLSFWVNVMRLNLEYTQK